MTLREIGFLDKNYYKTNYLDVLKIITPTVYINEDVSLSGIYIDPLAQIINAHIDFAVNVSSTIRKLNNLTIFSSIDTIQGISQFFVKQNGLTFIDPLADVSKSLQ